MGPTFLNHGTYRHGRPNGTFQFLDVGHRETHIRMKSYLICLGIGLPTAWMTQTNAY